MKKSLIILFLIFFSLNSLANEEATVYECEGREEVLSEKGQKNVGISFKVTENVTGQFTNTFFDFRTHFGIADSEKATKLVKVLVHGTEAVVSFESSNYNLTVYPRAVLNGFVPAVLKTKHDVFQLKCKQLEGYRVSI